MNYSTPQTSPTLQDIEYISASFEDLNFAARFTLFISYLVRVFPTGQDKTDLCYLMRRLLDSEEFDFMNNACERARLSLNRFLFCNLCFFWPRMDDGWNGHESLGIYSVDSQVITMDEK